MDKSPSKGGAHYRGHVAAVERRKRPGALRIPSQLELWMLWILLWQRLAYMEGKHRRVGRTKHLCQQASQMVKRVISSAWLRRAAVLGTAPSPEQPWRSGITVSLPVGLLLPVCRGNGVPVLSRSCSLAPALRVPGGASLTGLQRLDHGHLVGLWQRAALLGSPHLFPGHPGVAGGSLRHPAKWRKVWGGERGAA